MTIHSFIDSNLCAYIILKIHQKRNLPKSLYLISQYYEIPSLFKILFLSQIETHFIKIGKII